MANGYRIRTVPGTWVVRAGGAVLGETSRALGLAVNDSDEVIYFPREDFAMAFLDPSDTTTHKPGKGDTRYYSIVTKSQKLRDVAWIHEAPTPGIARLAGHVAFRTGNQVTVEEL